ncbi:maker217 [Drosophila busckii]|uniref:Maker217 n=2 Tax=Drosophila busckii TaxID=30019 RepID=A0A0M4EJB6_DROBS|nr:maker217 [Drosophila busckii]
MNSTKNKKDDKQKDNTALGTATKSLPQVPEGFPLMDWLNGGNEKMIQQGYNDEYYKDIQTDNVNISRANNLQFAMLDGVEYAFYKAESGLQMGYMRFKPLQIKGIQHTKIKLMFVVLHGMFEVRTKNKSKHIEEFKIKAGDYLEVKANCRYNIQNCSKNVSILMVHRNYDSNS